MDDKQYPSTKSRENAVVVQYTAGYGDPNDVPAAVQIAMKLIIGHYYEHRCSVVTGTIAAVLPMGVDALLATNSYGFYG